MNNYQILFYHSGRTAHAEQAINDNLERAGLTMLESDVSVTPQELARQLSGVLSHTDLVFVVGGLDGGIQSTDNVLSSVLSKNADEIVSSKLIDKDGNTAYLMQCKRQTIVLLPDDPETIEKMMDARINSELKRIYELKFEENTKPPFDEVSKELDSKLSSRTRVRSIPDPEQTPLKKRKREQMKVLSRMRIAAIALLSIGCVELIIAVTLLITNMS